MTKTHIEELLLQANPVGDTEQVRLTSDEVEARCATILERRDVMAAPTSTRDESVPVRGNRPGHRPVFAFALGLVVILATVGGIVLWVGGGGDTAVDEPVVTTVPATTLPPTTNPPQTTAPPALDGQIVTLAYADVPSFTGTIQYYEHDPATGEPGWQATVQIRHAGPLAFEATVVEESGEFVPLGGAGTVFFADGSDVWVLEGGSRGPFLMPFEPFRHVIFDGEHLASAWDEICGITPTELGVETIAGRTVTHVACSSDREEYELWVDEESGIVLRMGGRLPIMDYAPYLARDGLFEFTEIVFEPVETPPAPEPATAGSDVDVPPLHMISRESGEYWKEKETWYFDDRTLRETIIDAADPSHIGSFVFAADGRAGGCHPAEGFCEVEEVPDGQTSEFFSQVPEDLVAEKCVEGAADTVADRQARHYVCESIRFDGGDDGWRASTDADAGTTEFWYDTETGLMVKSLYETWSWEVTALEINPQFPAGVFEYVGPEYVAPDDAVVVGDNAPAWSGPLVGGGTFDVADQVGTHVLVYNWSPHYGVVGLDFLYEFQLLSDAYSNESLTFVSVSEDTLAETTQVLDRMEITVPTVHCGWDPNQVCLPESPWFLWRNGIPSVTVIDPDGIVVGVFAEPPIDAELEQLLGDISS